MIDLAHPHPIFCIINNKWHLFNNCSKMRIFILKLYIYNIQWLKKTKKNKNERLFTWR